MNNLAIQRSKVGKGKIPDLLKKFIGNPDRDRNGLWSFWPAHNHNINQNECIFNLHLTTMVVGYKMSARKRLEKH